MVIVSYPIAALCTVSRQSTATCRCLEFPPFMPLIFFGYFTSSTTTDQPCFAFLMAIRLSACYQNCALSHHGHYDRQFITMRLPVISVVITQCLVVAPYYLTVYASSQHHCSPLTIVVFILEIPFDNTFCVCAPPCHGYHRYISKNLRQICYCHYLVQ